MNRSDAEQFRDFSSLSCDKTNLLELNTMTSKCWLFRFSRSKEAIQRLSAFFFPSKIFSSFTRFLPIHKASLALPVIALIGSLIGSIGLLEQSDVTRGQEVKTHTDLDRDQLHQCHVVGVPGRFNAVFVWWMLLTYGMLWHVRVLASRLLNLAVKRTGGALIDGYNIYICYFLARVYPLHVLLPLRKGLAGKSTDHTFLIYAQF